MGYLYTQIGINTMKRLYLSDTALLEGLSRNERAAMNQVYDEYHDALVKWIVNKGGQIADADDVFQEAVLVLFHKAQDATFCLNVRIGTYLFAIAKRLWMKKISSKSATHTLYLDDDSLLDDQEKGFQDDLKSFEVKEMHFNHMYEALNSLGSPCNQLLKAFYIDGKSMQEIATEFKYSNAENAKTQKYKCLTRLKKIFFSQKSTNEKTLNPFMDLN